MQVFSDCSWRAFLVLLTFWPFDFWLSKQDIYDSIIDGNVLYVIYECPQRKLKKMPKWWKTEEDPAILPRQWPRKLDKNRLWEKHCQIIQDLPPIFWNLPTGMERWGANMRRGMRCWLWNYPHHFLVKAVDRDGPGLQPHPDPLKVNSCYNYSTD